MKKVIIAYIPVLHKGYMELIKKHKDADTLFIFGDEITKDYYQLSKEIRALDPAQIKKAIESLKIARAVKILTKKQLAKLNNPNLTVVAPNEDVTIELISKFLPKVTAHFDQLFLRWDKHKSIEEKPINPDHKITRKEFDILMMRKAFKISGKSSDWWRHVGGIIIKNGDIIYSAYNKHLPSDHSPYTFSDPRNNFHKGINIEISTAIHAEAALIAQASKNGMSLAGTQLYLTTFPCPACAKLVALSGIDRLYYTGGYGVLDASDILKQNGVEIVFVDLGEETKQVNLS